jgi:hypothetical protein
MQCGRGAGLVCRTRSRGLGVSARTRAARGTKLRGPRARKSDRMRVVMTQDARQRGAAANRMPAVNRAADLAPMIAELRAEGAKTLAAIAEGLNMANIPTPRGVGV